LFVSGVCVCDSARFGVSEEVVYVRGEEGEGGGERGVSSGGDVEEGVGGCVGCVWKGCWGDSG
jgi:hypothetical protein